MAAGSFTTCVFVHFLLFAVFHTKITSCKFLGIKDGDALASELAEKDTSHIDMLHELEAAAGRGDRVATERKVARIEESMRATFDALPKSESGRLGASGVRYMLHRFFVKRHAWSVKGLDTDGEAWNSSSPTDIVESHVEHGVQSIFTDQLNNHGFDLHHAAVLAATLENLVHKESMVRLEKACSLQGIAPNDFLVGTGITSSALEGRTQESLLDDVMQTYILLYVLHKRIDYSRLTFRWAEQMLGAGRILEYYPSWNNTVSFAKEISKKVSEEATEDDDSEGVAGASESWNLTMRVLDRFGDEYGRWQNHECLAMKHILVGMEEPNTGRVPLHRFYGNTSQAYQFRETVPYLRQLGALDETNPESMSVIIPNYLNGPNNCVAGSKFYDVCCIDECDVLITHLEQHLAASEAYPRAIIKLVSNLPSDTVKVPRKLPEMLLQRLEEIATYHGGVVPLHGRLFLQWMHHAYPRECEYPHISGATKALSSQGYEKQTGARAVISEEELSQYHQDLSEDTRAKDRAYPNAEAYELPWSSEEELFCNAGKASGKVVKQTAYVSLLVKYIVIIAIFCVSAVGIISPKAKTIKWVPPRLRADIDHKYYV